MECCVLMGDGDEEVYAAGECDVGDGNLVLTQAIGKLSLLSGLRLSVAAMMASGSIVM